METMLVETVLVETELVETALVETSLVETAPGLGVIWFWKHGFVCLCFELRKAWNSKGLLSFELPPPWV